MMRKFKHTLVAVLLLCATSVLAYLGWSWMTRSSEPSEPNADVHEAGSTFLTEIQSDVGTIVVQVSLPESARYADGAPVVVTVPTFFTPEITGFHPVEGITDEGVISISLMYPGRTDDEGHTSDGENDYGGSNSLAALRDVTLFALGEHPNADGKMLDELSAVTPAYDAVGLYAFSHPGIAATGVLASYPDALANVAFLVGRENPTLDLFSALELGHFDGKEPVQNPLYEYPRDYAPNAISLSYDSVRYDRGTDRPYFDLNANGNPDAESDFLFGPQIPSMFGKRFYSRTLLHALLDNGALAADAWPEDLATPEEADRVWNERESNADTYRALAAFENLRVMLVFAERGHVQPSPDKPSVHQAFDGFRSAGAWIRLNPDGAYVGALSPSGSVTNYAEHPAGDEPSDWLDSESWAHPSGAVPNALYPVAAILEMADRAHADNWEDDLDATLYEAVAAAEPEMKPTEITWESAGNGTYWVNNPASGSRLFVTVLEPSPQPDATRALVLVPGATGTSETFLRNKGTDARKLVEAGYLVVLFDPEGRGKSEGKEDDNGFVGQDGLAAVIAFASEQTGGKDVGVVSLSYGISMASGAIARHPDLPVTFLIDWEGPADRNDTGACDADKTGHLAAAGCDNEAFWTEREAITFVDDLTVPYLRIQTQTDHAQPDVLSAVRMINAAVAGTSPWIRLNDEPADKTYDVTTPPTMFPEPFDRNLMERIGEYANLLFGLKF